MDSLTPSQLNGYNIIIAGYNAFITGDAGTGKSFLLKKIIEYFEARELNVLITAPTGIAALNIDGSTIHRTFKIPTRPLIGRPGAVRDEIKMADVIIIDEISMCRIDLFDYVSQQILRANEFRRHRGKRDIQLIVVGDFFQLPPVITDRDRDVLTAVYGDGLGDGYAFQSRFWNTFNFQNIVLREVVRQSDRDFVYWLNQARIGNVRSLDYFSVCASPTHINNAIMLCGTNNAANEVNTLELNKLHTQSVRYTSEIDGEVRESDKMTSDVLELKVGARVMTLVNDADDRYRNGSFGTITKLKNDCVTVEIDGWGTVDIEYYTWDIIDYALVNGVISKRVLGHFTQIPLKVAYAITIHKSQGQTYEAVNLNPYCWDKGQLYVALSRCKSVQNMYLTNRLQYRFLVTSQVVKEFYYSL